MKSELSKLIESALNSTKFRGHSMVYQIESTKKAALYICEKCGMSVAITANPAPNGCEIMGEAVALHCTTLINKNWKLSKRYDESTDKNYWFVENTKTGFCDYPLKIGSQVLYDNPQIIPEYFQKQVFNFLFQ